MRRKFNRKGLAEVSFLLMGLVSTIWFLVRVIPKPSRAGYPCIRAAAPFMSSFVLYLISIMGSAILFKKSWTFLYRRRYYLSSVLLLAGIITSLFTSHLVTFQSFAGTPGAVPSDFPANEPYGTGLGNNPGRVVWAWNNDATDENCTNVPNDPQRGEDGYFLAKNNNREVISKMLDDVVLKITGAANVNMAWDSLFTSLNTRKGLGNKSYQDGQTIFIKINQGQSGWLSRSKEGEDLSYKDYDKISKYWGETETTPALVIEMLDQLVNGYGIPQNKIYVSDPKSHIYKHTYDQMHAVFPQVRYMDKDAYHTAIGRTILTPSTENIMIYSDKGKSMKNAVDQAYYEEMINADYMINIAALKAHALAGVTLTSKNHFGSITESSAADLHPGLICNADDVPWRTEYGMYRVLTDIMGHKSLGGNTVLFIVDGLWGGTEASDPPVKWNMAPFNGDWSSSLFASQDQVALESVCFDFLRTEFDDPDGPGKARPWMGGVDDHLHQAADKQFWPAGISYDPENDGTPIGSLGIHEHWNNPLEKKYSRNLGQNQGIELLQVAKKRLRTNMSAQEAQIVPFIDGMGNDKCWTASNWYDLAHEWSPWNLSGGEDDFSGRFQVSWSGTTNLLYFFVEISDDQFVDGYQFPAPDSRAFDLLQVFIDEDASGGYHAFEGYNTLESNAENAFAYNLHTEAPAEGGVHHSWLASDFAGTGMADKLVDYSDHFEDFAVRKDGNVYSFEFALKVYEDTYQDDSPETSRASLSLNKELGFSMAYGDNDSPGLDREAYFGSVPVPDGAEEDHWFDADYFGILTLVESTASPNQAVLATGTIEDFLVTEFDKEVEIVNGINELFDDPDGDPLRFSVECSDTRLLFSTENNVLKVLATSGFEGEQSVKLLATDGEFIAEISFSVIARSTAQGDIFVLGEGVHCYPNPFQESIFLEFNRIEGQNQQVKINLYNMRGQHVYATDFELAPGLGATHSLDLSGHFSGLYVLEVHIGNETLSRIIKKK